MESELFQHKLGKSTFLKALLAIECDNQVKLGNNVYINHYAKMIPFGGIEIEGEVMIGPEWGFFTVNHEPKNIRTVMIKTIHIKKNAWLGARVSVLPGVTIGENTIIGTGSVVTKDISDNSIAVGNPARVIRIID